MDINLQKLSKDAIKNYFYDGYSYLEIIKFVSKYHDISISLRRLHRILRNLGLFRRKQHSNVNEILLVLIYMLKDSSSSLGYRSMHQKLRRLGYITNKETVRLCLKNLEESHVALRQCWRLQRQQYISPGPDHMWHIEGYDKLKSYGFAIHGAIDGFSRKIIWLNVSSSNNNPAYIAYYFIQSITELGRNPQVVRGDRGSENITLCGTQRFLRRNFSDSFSGYDSFRYGSSASNQQIEAWWYQFRKAKGTWWINFFKDLIDSNVYDNSINHHVDFMRFCFMFIIQQKLDEIKSMWNTHYIREVRNFEWPPGRPNVLYFMPEQLGGRSFRFPVNEIDVNARHHFCELPYVNGCTNETHELVRLIIREEQLEFPSNATEAKNLFISIISKIETRPH